MSTTITQHLFQQQEWQEDALCAQTSPDLFFPEDKAAAREAKTVCMSCDVREKCLNWAIETKQDFGIWGGTTLRERNKIAKGGSAEMAMVKSLSRNQTIVNLHDKGVSIDVLAEKFDLPEVGIERIINRAKTQRANQQLEVHRSAS